MPRNPSQSNSLSRSAPSPASSGTRTVRRRQGISVREHDTRRDLLELQSLLDGGMRPAEIARYMGKDPAWVSRSTRRVRENPLLAYRPLQEAEIVGRHHAQLEMLFSMALRAVTADAERVNLSAVRTAARLRKQILDFEMRVGMVEPRQRNSVFTLNADQLRMIHDARLNREYDDDLPV